MTRGDNSGTFNLPIRPHSWSIGAITFLLLVLAVLPRLELTRLKGFHGDELAAIESFLRQPLGRTFTVFDAGANHPLYNLLARATTRTEIILWNARMPACLAGIVAVPLLFLFVRSHAGVAEAAAAAAVLALAKSHIEHSAFARGYTLAVLGMIVAQWLFMAAFHSNRWSAWGGYVVASSLAAYAHLWTLLGLFGQFVFVLVWTTFYRSTPWKRFLISVLIVLGISGLCYAPMASDIWERLATRRERPFGPEFLEAMRSIGTFGRPVVGTGEWTLSMHVFMIGSILVALAQTGFARDIWGMSNVVTVAVVLAVVGIMRPASFFPRYLLFLLPLYLSASAAAVAHIRRHCGLWVQHRDMPATESGAMEWSPAGRAARNPVGRREPRGEAPGVWQLLAMRLSIAVLVASVLAMRFIPAILDSWDWITHIPRVSAAVIFLAALAWPTEGRIRREAMASLGAAGVYVVASLASEFVFTDTGQAGSAVIVLMVCAIVVWREIVGGNDERIERITLFAVPDAKE